MVPDESVQEGAGSLEGADVKDRLLKQLRSLEDWYSEELERHVKDLADIVNSELQSQVEEIRSQYQERRQESQQALAQLPPVQNSSQVAQEISRCETSVAQCTAELERLLVREDNAALGLLMKIRTQELELKAYLRGLKFLANPDPKIPPSEKRTEHVGSGS